MHRVVRSPWAGPHLRDRGADCLHFFMCIAIMDMFAQLSKADGLTSSSLWSLSVCVCPVPPEDIGSSSLLKRVDDIVCLITVGATVSRDHSSVAERNVFKNVKLEGVTYASEFEVVDDSLLVTLPAALSPTRVAMEEVKVPLKLLTKLKQQSAPERVLAAMSPASHSSSEGSPREDRPTKSFTGGIGKEGLKAADASQKALLHFTAPMADEDLITQLLAPGRLELIQRTSNAEEMKTELPRSLSPKRRSQPMIFNQEPNPKFVQSLPSKPHPEARQARANSVSEVHRRSPGLGEDGEAEAPHPKTPTGTGSSASHYSRSNIRSHVSRVTGPGVHTVAGKPLSKSASVSLVSNARDLEKLARSAKSSVTLPVPDTPVRAPRGAAHTKSHGLKKTFLYSPLLLDQVTR